MSMTAKERLELGRAFKVRNENGESYAKISTSAHLSREKVRQFINVAIIYEISVPIGPLSGIWRLCYEGKISRHEATILHNSGVTTIQNLKSAISARKDGSPASRKIFDVLSEKRWEELECIVDMLDSAPRKPLSEIATLYYEGKIKEWEMNLLRLSKITTIRHLKEAISIDKGKSAHRFEAFPVGSRIRWKELERIVDMFETDTDSAARAAALSVSGLLVRR